MNSEYNLQISCGWVLCERQYKQQLTFSAHLLSRAVFHAIPFWDIFLSLKKSTLVLKCLQLTQGCTIQTTEPTPKSTLHQHQHQHHHYWLAIAIRTSVITSHEGTRDLNHTEIRTSDEFQRCDTANTTRIGHRHRSHVSAAGHGHDMKEEFHNVNGTESVTRRIRALAAVLPMDTVRC